MWIFIFIVIFCNGCVYSETLHKIQFHNLCGSSISKDAGSLQFNSSELPRSLLDKKCSVNIQPITSDSQITFYFEQIKLTGNCTGSNLTITQGNIYHGETTVSGLPKWICGVNSDVVKKDERFTSGKGHMTITYFFSDLREQFSDTFRIIFFNFHTGSCSDDEFGCSNGQCINKVYQCSDDIRTCPMDKEVCESQSSVFMNWMISILIFTAGLCFIATVIYVLAKYHNKLKSCTQQMLPERSTSHERRNSVVDDDNDVPSDTLDYGDTQLPENNTDIQTVRITTSQYSIGPSVESEQSNSSFLHTHWLNSGLSTREESVTSPDVSIPLDLSTLSNTRDPPPSYEDTLVPSYDEVMDNEHKYKLFRTVDS